MKDVPREMPLFGIYGRPWSDQVGAMMGSSWHLKGILRRLIFIIVFKVQKRGGTPNSGTFARAPKAPGGGDIGEGKMMQEVRPNI